MIDNGRFQGTTRHIYAQWPGYLLRYGGLVLALLMIGSGLVLGRQLLLALGLVLLMAGLLLLWAALWTAHKLYDTSGLQTTEVLFNLSQVQATDPIACIDLGLRQQAIILSRHLTTGQITVIDVYNPQLAAAAGLARARHQAPAAQTDPRLIWYDGSINLLPMPDKSVTAVFLPQILSEFSQHGDRQAILREVRRILKPNGRLLLAEQTASWLNWLRVGPGTSKLQPAEYWHNLLLEADFELRRQEDLQGLMLCLRADVPSPYAGQQLPLALTYAEE
jgi:SAM-dependent methyltransferase